jgi:hypothetical protein
VQLVMHHLDARSRFFLARCNRSLLRDAQAAFAWQHCIINVPATRALHDPRFLDQLRSSRFRSLPTRLCWSAAVQQPADTAGEVPVPPLSMMDVLLDVATLLARPVAIEAAGSTIDWPALLTQPNMQSITAVSINQFDVLQLHTLEVLCSLPRLHQLELRLVNPGQVHDASVHLPLLMQLPALDDLTCDFAIWMRIAPMRPARPLKRLEIHFMRTVQTSMIRMALGVPQLADVEVLSLHYPFIRSSAEPDNAFDKNAADTLLHLKSMRDFLVRVRHSDTFIPLLQLYMSPTVERLQIDCVDHVPSPSLLHMLASRRPSLILIVCILFIDKPRPAHIDPSLFRALTHGSLARRVRIEGLGSGDRGEQGRDQCALTTNEKYDSI